MYSWLPSPEYDPHVEPEEGELEDERFEYAYADSGDADMDVDMDLDLSQPSVGAGKDGNERDGGDAEAEAMWGQAGMEIEEEIIPLHNGGVEVLRTDGKGKRRTSDMPPPALLPGTMPGLGSASMAKRASMDDEMIGLERTGGGLLWSANYFFYSK